jgi:hypothetical protein
MQIFKLKWRVKLKIIMYWPHKAKTMYREDQHL